MADILSAEEIDRLLDPVDTEYEPTVDKEVSRETLIIESFKEYNHYSYITHMLFFVMLAKDFGLLTLSRYLDGTDPFTDEILELAIDGTEPIQIKNRIMELALEQEQVLKSFDMTENVLESVRQKFTLLEVGVDALQQGLDLASAAKALQENS